jgi:DNA-binding transcriptional ArsR family regulator
VSPWHPNSSKIAQDLVRPACSSLREARITMQHVQGSSWLLPLLRSPLVGELLAWLFLRPDESFSVTELAKRFASSQSTVSREADRLVASGLVREVRRGNLRLLQADTSTALARPLSELLALTYGPVPVLSELLGEADGVDEAYVYGSWAARYSGEPGPPPRDIDVIVVGDADEDDLFDVARTAEQKLGREVNIRVVDIEQWHRHGDDPFLAAVRSRPLVPIIKPEESQ